MDTLDSLTQEAAALLKRAYDIGKVEALERILNYAAADEATLVSPKGEPSKPREVMGMRMYEVLSWIRDNAGEPLPHRLGGQYASELASTVARLCSHGWIVKRAAGFAITASGRTSLAFRPSRIGQNKPKRTPADGADTVTSATE